MSDLNFVSGSQRRGGSSATAIQQVEETLAKIASLDDTFHAVSQVFEEPARRHAEGLDLELAEGLAPRKLHGVPFLAKELVDIAGAVTRFGSHSYATLPADKDAPIIERLKAAGATLIGTSQMVEFAYGSWGTNYLRGTPWNPCDRSRHRVPGGSSSGSAVAVAAGYVPVAIGSDTGGSIRIPSSLCGVIGFKPSFDLIPTTGVAPLGPTFDTIGPITKTITDARYFTEIMSGRTLRHPPVSIAGRRIAILTPEALSPCAPEVERAYLNAVMCLEANGGKMFPIDLPMSLADFQALNGSIVGYEAFTRLEGCVENWRLPMDPFVRERVRSNRGIDQSTYERQLSQMARVRAQFSASFSGFDALFLPTTPLCAPLMSEVNEEEIPLSRYTRVANCLDLCAISLPLPHLDEGLPIGMQLCASAGKDAFLLAMAETCLEAMTWVSPAPG